ncbi:vacuolar fusion protein MON1 [Protomyces lactucae-debilis]|uniref:Vacuolar fusion protein MON1 n=1 Tax=Protomyces lactucae-debilis TaxID=2754530 RepID=A0A1Y2F0V6_PROLT|nr:vacuolar fusion protein MON1 [Protomyces lactucae-debilis]ORY76605.1 vacuolar fusion protein MON1 [Protomyces lactucae-debilis]
MGIIQAIMGFYQDSGDALQSYVCDDLSIVLVVHGPVYLVAISKLREGTAALRVQLDLLYAHILSTVTATALKRVYDRSENFDLSRMIQGAEVFLDRLSDDMIRGDLSIMLSAVQVLRLRKKYRTRIHNILQASRQGAALLYGLIACDKHLVGILRPHGHSLYPADLRILFETVYSRGFEQGGEYWLPLCLPKFNASGFLHIYVYFITRSISLILVSADKESFFELQGIKETVCRRLEKDGLIRELKKAAQKPVTCKEVGAGQLEHFFYKARSKVQFVAPGLPPALPKSDHVDGSMRIPTQVSLSRKRICQVYARLLAAPTHKIEILHFEDGLLGLCWQTNVFQICLIAREARCDTGGLIAGANAIHHYMRREEGRVLLSDGAVF